MECEFSQAIQDMNPGQGDRWCNLAVLGDDDEVLQLHVVPINDADGHQAGLTCHCGPEIEYKDPETGEPYDYPLIVHQSFDGRQAVEEAERIING